ncbi:MAG TPA: ferredoxin reductase [Anaeromyxobacteraceae bacterium]|nr:ferredoxin reductase [Anaeromyxobacteraceae bacterium]
MIRSAALHLPARRIASSLARRLLLDRQARFWLRELDPTWSLEEIRARVVAVIAETPDVKTFVLRPNRAWRGHLAGQYTTVEVEIDGSRVRRCYSISSAPGDALLTITVKRLPGGRVSGWLHDRVKPGDVLGLAAAAGDFVLLRPTPAKLLMLGGGSGITPMMAMLRDLAARRAMPDVVLVHHARSAGDVIFSAQLHELAARHRGLRVILCLSDGASEPGRFDEEQLLRLVPDLADRETFLCGPPSLMRRVERLWARVGASHRLHSERFTSPDARAPVASSERAVTVTLTHSGRSFAASSGTLLEQLEREGERPSFGCRMGICRTCRCRKLAGTVENVVTGAVSSEPDEDIQPCISVARSDVELGL